MINLQRIEHLAAGGSAMFWNAHVDQAKMPDVQVVPFGKPANIVAAHDPSMADMHKIHALAVDAVMFDGGKEMRQRAARLFDVLSDDGDCLIAKPRPITVVVWKWNGWRAVYNADHVNAFERMLRQHLSVPHRMLCITDDPKGVNCETFPLWDKPVVATLPRKPNCYKRLRMFSDWAADAIGDRFISMDLDAVIMRNIDHIIQRDDDFVILEGRAAPYNGSLWMHRPGTRTQVWDDFDPRTSPAEAAACKRSNGKSYYGSDQAWISHKLPDEAKYTHEADGVCQFGGAIHNGMAIQKDQSIVFFAGGLKPWDAHFAGVCPALHNEYMFYLRNA